MRTIDFKLGDERLNQRGQYCIGKLLQEPTLSFPEVFNQSKELQGFYRFINNESFSSHDLKDSILSQTKKNLGTTEEAIVIHDTTQMKLPAKAMSIAEFKFSKGFFAHLSLVVDAKEGRQIFGAGGLHFYSREGKVVKKGASKEQERWLRQVQAVEANFNHLRLIHVMDREGDMHEVWSEMKNKDQRFVIRAKFDRYVKSPDSQEQALWLFEQITQVKPIAQREVLLSKRRLKLFARQRTAHQVREPRESILNISAHSFEIYKTLKEKKAQKDTVELNIIRVFEEPTLGVKSEDLIEWVLITNEPILSPEQILRVVDIYKTRWLIEEFFKVLKSGCRLDDRLFSEAESWYKVFTLLLPVATSLLNLRLREDEVLEEKNLISTLNDVQLRILSTKAIEFKKEFKTYEHVQYVLAQLGGHIKANGPPGWITLLRGYRKLLNLEQGWNLARCDI